MVFCGRALSAGTRLGIRPFSPDSTEVLPSLIAKSTFHRDRLSSTTLAMCQDLLADDKVTESVWHCAIRDAWFCGTVVECMWDALGRYVENGRLVSGFGELAELVSGGEGSDVRDERGEGSAAECKRDKRACSRALKPQN
jgi:hypothetical protein